MYHQPPRRKLLVRRIVAYGMMTTAVVTLVTLLIFVMLGYRYSDNGKIEQDGLVQFGSRPSGANVTIDGQPFRSRTPSKTTLTSGSHTVIMERNGYRTWQKTVDIVPGSVLWLSYARLVPTDLRPENVASLQMVSSTAVSLDDEWMAIKEKPNTPEITLADIRSDKVELTSVTIPSDAYTHPVKGKPQAFKVVDWDQSGRYLIVKHTYGSRGEWLVVDTRGAATKNITRLLDIQATKVVFSGNDSQILYAQIGADIRKIDLGAATLSRPLVTDAAEFTIYDQRTIVYTTTRNPETKLRSVGYYEDGDPEATVVKSFKDDGKAPLHMALGRYFGKMYITVAYGDKVTVYVGDGDLPATADEAANLKEVASMDFPGGVRYLTNRTSGRFVVAQRGNVFKTYDLELKKQTTTKVRGGSKVTGQLEWLDGYTALGDYDGMLRLYEFDGTNQHDIMKVVPGFNATLSPNAKYLYGIGKDSSGYHLRRVQMILP